MMPEATFAARCRRARHFASLVVLIGLLAGCSSTFDALPQAVGGLPAEAPARSANPAAFPEVHNMPPDRRAPVLSEDERKRAESDLVAVRDRQQRSSAAVAKQEQDDADGTSTSVTPAKSAAKPKPTKKNAKPVDASAGTGRNP